MSSLSKGVSGLTDLYAERLLLSSLINNGAKALHTIEEYIDETDFELPANKAVYTVYKNLILKDEITKPGIAEAVSILQNQAPDLDDKIDFLNYLSILSEDRVDVNNIKPFCLNVKKIALARKLSQQLMNSAENLKKVDGSESLLDIIHRAETPITEFINSVLGSVDTQNIYNNLDEYLQYLSEAKPQNLGIPTGFPRFDYAIGGGLRKPGVHLIGGRAKVGKTNFAINIANNVSNLKIPVLYLDTEVTREHVLNRLITSNCNIDLNILESGKFDIIKLSQKINKFKENKFSYHNISGLQHHEWISIIRRWLLKEVGFHPDGTAKDCLIVLDYIKTMDLGVLKNLSEWQYLGQVITDLHNTAIKYNIPILSFTQLNREGITNDHQGVIAGSDRLMALCSSFTILRKKTPEDLAADPVKDTQGRDLLNSGDRKLVVIDCRFGPGLEQGEYINVWTDLSKGQMREGYTNIENQQGVNNPINNQTPVGVVDDSSESKDDDNGEPPPF